MWDILYLVDASSSMADSHKSRTGRSFVKIDAVKDSLDSLLLSGAFPFGSRLGVATFQAPTRAGGLLVAGGAEMVKVVLPLTPTLGLTRDLLKGRLDTIRVSGATPSGAAIEEGLRQLYGSADGRMKRIKKLTMITDERSNVGPRPEKVVSDEVATKAIIDVISIGGRINRETLEKVASKTGGKFASVEGADELLDAMNPKIEMMALAGDASLLEESAMASAALEAGKKSGQSSPDYLRALEAVEKVRTKLEKRLREVMMLKSQTESEMNTLASQLDRSLPMRDYAKRIWPRASELEQLGKAENELRRSLEKLAG